MFTEEYGAVAAAAVGKIALLKKNPVGYFLSAFLAGMFIGFGVLLAFTVGGILTGEIYGKIVMGATFGVALSLVVMAGAELFTGNNFVITAGELPKKAGGRGGGFCRPYGDGSDGLHPPDPQGCSQRLCYYCDPQLLYVRDSVRDCGDHR